MLELEWEFLWLIELVDIRKRMFVNSRPGCLSLQRNVIWSASLGLTEAYSL